MKKCEWIKLWTSTYIKLKLRLSSRKRTRGQFVFISIVQFMVSTNSRIRFGLQMVFVCLYITLSHYHHCANFIWGHWTYKMPFRYNLSTLWVRLSIFSQLSIAQYVGLCVFSLPIYIMMIERIYILCLIIIIWSEVWTITQCLGIGHETMVCAVCLSIFLIFLINLWEARHSVNANRSAILILIFFHRSQIVTHAWVSVYASINCIYYKDRS